MFLNRVALQNFRTYKKASWEFSKTNIIIGPNTIGKTNILEAIYFLSHGTSFRAQKDVDTIKTGEEFARIEAEIKDNEKDKNKLSLTLVKQNGFFRKKFIVNNIARRQLDFVSKFLTVLFTPEDIEIITDSPSLRRKYFDNILFQANKRYRLASTIYEKALRHRNRMLSNIREGKKLCNKKEFEYWDNLLIDNGKVLTQEREKIIRYMNESHKDTFDFQIIYDKSTVTVERIEKYFEIEQKIGVTLIGPQRDEFVFLFPNPSSYTSDGTDERSEGVRLLDKRGDEAMTSTPRAAVRQMTDSGDARPRWTKTIKEFGSRGEQRLTIFQMKL